MGKMMENLGWPISCLLGFMFFCFYYRNELKNLINRISKIDKSGVTTNNIEPQQTLESKTSSVEDLLNAFDSPLLLEQEKVIKEELTTKGIIKEEEKVKVLIRHLSASHIYLSFEKIDKSIYGSQLQILYHLNSKLEGDTEEKLKSFYDNAVSNYPSINNYQYSSYLQYLQANGLIIKENDILKITLLGVGFLEYMVKMGYSINRHL